MRRSEELLSKGDVEVLGLLPDASNATLLVRVHCESETMLAVYKPQRGERPLWDFPDGTLCLREYAAYLVGVHLGWGLVPPTVLREGPAGFGAIQLFVEPDAGVDVRALPRTHPADLQRLALFDVVVNNADRKAGHLVVDGEGRLWGVDHGLCFAAEPKLRTVVWAYEGHPVPEQLIEELESSVAGACRALTELLSSSEVEAFRERVKTVLVERRFPLAPAGRRSVPWPPW